MRLPANWDEHATWSVTVNWDKSPQGYANILRFEEAEGIEEDAERIYEMTLYPALMDQLSDAACRWVLAHEFGHIASGLAHGSIVIKGKPYTRIKGTIDEYEEPAPKYLQEFTADQVPLDWGFASECDAFLSEAPGWSVS